MPRNGTGSYLLPTSINPVTDGTVISASWANPTLTDVANGLTGSLPRDGQAPMTGSLKLADGTASSPGMGWNSDAATGIFRPATSTLAFTAGGIEQARFTAGNLLLGSTSDTGEKLQVTGTLKLTGPLNLSGILTGGATAIFIGAVTAPSFIGALTGNASSATLQQVVDTRAAATGPSLGAAVARWDFKANTTDGLADAGSYHAVLSIQQYSDATGGGVRQLAFTDNDNMWLRGSGTAQTSYGAWKRVLDSSSIGSYAPSLTGTGASGTWPINVTGNAATATNATNAGNASTLSGFTIGARLSNDFNSYLTNGHFSAQASPANAPTPYASLINASNSDVGLQVSGGYTSDNLYFRGWYSSGASFTPWRTVYHTGNLNVMNSSYVAGSIAQRDGNGDITAHSFITQGTGYFLGNGAGLNGTASSLTAGGLVTNPTLNGTTYIGRTLADFGNQYAPAYSFKNDADTGMYSDGDGTLCFAVNQQQVGKFIGANFTVTGNIAAFSDARLKTNWTNMPEDFIERWAKVRAGNYDRIDTGETQVGLAAQDVQEIMPHATPEQENGYLALNYGGAAAVATVELAKEVIELRKLVKLLMAKVGVE